MLGDALGIRSDLFLLEPLQKQHEDVEFKIRKYGDLLGKQSFHTEVELAELIENQIESDLIIFDSRILLLLAEAEYLAPLEVFVDSSAVLNTEDFLSSSIDTIRNASEHHLLALPFARNAYGLMFNKDLFDQAQVPYPQDNMTWEDVFALASRFDATRDRPIDIDHYDLLASQYPVEICDHATGEINLDSKEWKKIGDLIFSVPDRRRGVVGNVNDGFPEFYRGKTAMIAGSLLDNSGGYRILHRNTCHEHQEERCVRDYERFAVTTRSAGQCEERPADRSCRY